jgi:hypothetical protein
MLTSNTDANFAVDAEGASGIATMSVDASGWWWRKITLVEKNDVS